MEKLNQVGVRLRLVWTLFWLACGMYYAVFLPFNPIAGFLAPTITWVTWYFPGVPWYIRGCLSFAGLGLAIFPPGAVSPGSGNVFELVLISGVLGLGLAFILVVGRFILSPLFNKED